MLRLNGTQRYVGMLKIRWTVWCWQYFSAREPQRKIWKTESEHMILWMLIGTAVQRIKKKTFLRYCTYLCIMHHVSSKREFLKLVNNYFSFKPPVIIFNGMWPPTSAMTKFSLKLGCYFFWKSASTLQLLPLSRLPSNRISSIWYQFVYWT